MNKESLQKAQKDINAIISNLAFKDMLAYNRKPKRDKSGLMKTNPYTLSSETLEAKKVYNLTFKEVITQDDEEIIKSYLLPFRTFRTELLIYKSGKV